MSEFKITSDKKEIIQKIKYGENYLIQGEAGTGKTLLGVLIGKKFVNKIKTSQKVLYLTFSKLAKWQIKNCIRLLGLNNIISKEEINKMEVYNFHSFWWNLLKDYRYFLGINKIPTILLDKELEEFSEKSLRSIPLESIPSNFLTRKGEINKNKIKQLLKVFHGEAIIFSKWNPRDFGDFGSLFDGSKDFLLEVKKQIIERNINGYFSHTETVFWIDLLFKKNLNLLNILKYKYPIIIIDEFQDIDLTQWSFVNTLLPSTLIALADKKQTIHQWRGAATYRIDKYCEEYKIKKENIITLTIRNRFLTEKQQPPEIEWIELSHTPLSKPQILNTAKKTAKFNCKKIILDSIKEKKSVAILCRTNNQANEITDFIRDMTNNFPGLICERLGAENSPFEKTREILLNIISLENNKKCIEYIANDIYFNLFPEVEQSSNRSKKDHLKRRYQNSIQVFSRLNKNFYLGIRTLIDILLEYEKIKKWKCNRSIIRSLKFIAREIQNINSKDWNEKSINEKRIIIDFLILEYENLVLSSLPIFPISIMTAHQSKSREFDWVIIPWFSSIAWNYQEGKPWDLTRKQDKNLFHTAHTRARERFYVIKTINNPPKNEIPGTQTGLNIFF